MGVVQIAYVHDWHWPMLEPLERELAARGVRVQQAPLEQVLKTDAQIEPPSLIIVADAGAGHWLISALPHVPVLHVGHGLISKNETERNYGAVDYICVASDWVVERLTQRGHTPRRRFFATGLIQTDQLFAPKVEPIRVQGVQTSLLFAPTWNDSLGSTKMLGEGLVEKIRGSDNDIGIVIKPHPHTAKAHPDVIDMLGRVARSSPNVTLLPADANVVPAMLGADLLVSDASSAIFHFLALDRPIVLIDNPARFDHPYSFDPDGIEWQWRDIGRRVDDVDHLSDAIMAELADKDARATVRQSRRRQLFGDAMDGRATLRVADAVQSILEGID